MNPFRLAWLNLTRRRVTTGIAVLAIALSVACSGILLRLDLASENRFATLSHGGDALIGAKAGNIEILLGALNGEGDYPGFLPYKLFQSLEAQQPVQFEDGARSQPSFIEAIIPVIYFAKLGHGPRAARVMGTSGAFFSRPRPEDQLKFRDGHAAEGPDQIVIGSEVAKQNNLSLGDHVHIEIWAGSAPPVSDASPTDLELTVSGILLPTRTVDDLQGYTSVETAQRCLSTRNLEQTSIWGSQVLHYFLVYLKPGGESRLQALVNRRTVAQVVRIDRAKEQLAGLTSVGQNLGIFITLLTLALGGLAVAAMLITRFESMTLQIAVLRAIGYKRKMIGVWLWSEGLIMGLGACVIGGALDAVGFPLVRAQLGAALPSSDVVEIAIWQSAPVWAAALIATIAAVFVPLVRIYRQNIHSSLRD